MPGPRDFWIRRCPGLHMLFLKKREGVGFQKDFRKILLLIISQTRRQCKNLICSIYVLYYISILAINTILQIPFILHLGYVFL